MKQLAAAIAIGWVWLGASACGPDLPEPTTTSGQLLHRDDRGGHDHYRDDEGDGDSALVHVESVEASGNWFGFARMSDGTVYGWGNNFGQLGDATNVQRDVPVKVVACIDASGAFISASSESGCEGLGGTLSELTRVMDLNTGQNHTLALIDNGTPCDESDDGVVAWGPGAEGQLGDGNASFSRTAVQVACGEAVSTEHCSAAGTLQGVSAIAAGGGGGGSTGHSLALLADGSVVAWGWNQFGQLGNGETGTTAATPVRVGCGEAAGTPHCRDGHLADVVAVEGSAASSFAILSDGTMLSWGLNARGWLGDGTTAPRPTPVFVTCGALGDTDHCLAEGHLRGVARLADDPTSGFTIVLLDDGTAAAWGANDFGQLGDGVTGDALSPVPVVGLGGSGVLTGVREVATGTIYALARLSDGTMAAWGNNYAGQLGDGTTASKSVPVPVIGVSSAVDISAGYDHSHALLSDGTILGWGNNNTSQLGLEAASGVATPVHVVRDGSVLTGVAALSAGGAFSLALQSDEAVLAWGGNDNGQLGNGTTNGTNTAIEVPDLGSGVVALATGFGFSAALRGDGAVQTWGGNGAGQLGDGTTTSRTSPGPVTCGAMAGTPFCAGDVLQDVAAIASHPTSSHMLALLSDGTMLAWGANNFGELGDGTADPRSAPVLVTCGAMAGTGFCSGGALQGVVAVASGNFHSLALLSDDTVLEWGAGLSTGPQRVDGLAGVSALGSRANVSLAVLSDGTVFQWRVGEAPAQVVGLTDVTAIAGGDTFALALRSDGTVSAFGSNSLGELGDGTTRSTSTPVQVMTCRDAGGELIGTLINSSCAALGGTLSELTDVVAVATGYNHALALLSDGTVLSWAAVAAASSVTAPPGRSSPSRASSWRSETSNERSTCSRGTRSSSAPTRRCTGRFAPTSPTSWCSVQA